jgi:uncharacterized protein (DUF488 family)
MTIGYEGLTSAQFLAMLHEAGVETLIDVRELPLSRKPGFSKKALAAAVTDAGIRYAHLPALGCPKTIRHDYRADGDWDRYSERFLDYLGSQDAALRDLTRRVGTSRCCLMCFEADYRVCHRSLIAELLKPLATDTLRIVHLRAPSLAKAA